LKPAFATATAIMTDSESDSEHLSEPFFTPDSEPGKDCDSEPDSEVEDALLAPLELHDSVSFSLSQSFLSIPLPLFILVASSSFISVPFQFSVFTFFEPDPAPLDNRDFHYIDICTRVAALAIFHTLPGTNEKKYVEVEKVTEMTRTALRKIRRKAKDRGYDFKTNKLRIRTEHLINASRSGRPNTACNPENEKQAMMIVTKDRNGREKSGEIIVSEVVPLISRQSVHRMLKKLGFKKIKKTIKPGLNDAQKDKRLEFCRKY
jgi:hypothetical protein